MNYSSLINLPQFNWAVNNPPTPRFSSKLFFHNIGYNTAIDWNIDLLTQTSRYWDNTALSLNKLLWEKVFPEFHRNSEHTIAMLEYLLKGEVKSE